MGAHDVVTRWVGLRPRALLLDFNGTLSDDEHLLQQIFAQVVSDRWGATLEDEDYRASLLGLSDREIAERLVERYGEGGGSAVEEILAVRRESYLRLTSSGSTVSRDARALVRSALESGARVGVVTGAQRVEVEHVLAACGLDDALDVVVCEEDVTRGKPDPEGYLAAADALGVPAGHCLVAEDSGVGIRAARAAGMAVVGVAGDHDPGRLDGADAVVDRLTVSLLP